MNRAASSHGLTAARCPRRALDVGPDAGAGSAGAVDRRQRTYCTGGGRRAGRSASSRPRRRSQEPVAEADEEYDVDRPPEHPGQEAAELEPAHRGDRRGAPDRRHQPLSVAERGRAVPAALSDLTAPPARGAGCPTWRPDCNAPWRRRDRLAVALHRRQVADHEDPRARARAVGQTRPDRRAAPPASAQAATPCTPAAHRRWGVDTPLPAAVVTVTPAPSIRSPAPRCDLDLRCRGRGAAADSRRTCRGPGRGPQQQHRTCRIDRAKVVARCATRSG